MKLAAIVDLGWRDVKTTPPDLHLLSAVLHDGLLLVQAGEPSVHALVQPPGFDDRDMELVAVLESDITCLDGSLQVRCVGHVELKTGLFEQLPAALGLSEAFLAQVHIDPACELARNVP